MEWYWIILIVFCYVAMWLLTSVFFVRKCDFTSGDATFLGFFWPISLIFVIIAQAVEALTDDKKED